MADQWTEVSVNGEFRKVPALFIDGLTIMITGRRLKTAANKDEWWLGADAVADPARLLEPLKKDRRGADLFVFSQKPPDTEPRYKFPMVRSNVAAIPITTYEDWWERRLTQVTRKNVRRSQRRGVVVKKVEFDDPLVEAIVRINNSTPVKQQRRNVHYGKSFDAVKKDYTDFGGRSDYWGAFYKEEMIGLLRMIYQGPIGNIMQLFCMPQHNDKRPANVLLAAAVEQCVKSGLSYLLYGQYIYGRNAKAPLKNNPSASSEVATGRLMNGAERFMAIPALVAPMFPAQVFPRLKTSSGALWRQSDRGKDKLPAWCRV